MADVWFWVVIKSELTGTNTSSGGLKTSEGTKSRLMVLGCQKRSVQISITLDPEESYLQPNYKLNSINKTHIGEIAAINQDTMSSDNSYDSAEEECYDDSYDSSGMNDDCYDREDCNYDERGKDMADAAPVHSVGSQTVDTLDTKKTMPRPARFGFKEHCDTSLPSLDPDDREQAALEVSKDERLNTIIKFKQELNDIKNKSMDPISGVAICKPIRKIRKQMVSKILRSARTKYETREHEYKAIGKFYRGMFRKVAYNDRRPRKDRLFDDTEKAILIEIAQAYGAFGY